jgi:DNA invertase Pin-like site-specific DNA recombinase
MKKKAIAYVSDIILGRTGEVINREYQKELIRQYAEDNKIEIVAWFEDQIYNEDVMSRTGIKSLLDYKGEYETVLVERVWALTRRMADLEPFFKELENKGVLFEAATTMWDCVSQMVRRRFTPTLYQPKAETPIEVVAEKQEKAAVSKPKRLVFADLVKVTQ